MLLIVRVYRLEVGDRPLVNRATRDANIVALECSGGKGRALARSSFRHGQSRALAPGYLRKLPRAPFPPFLLRVEAHLGTCASDRFFSSTLPAPGCVGAGSKNDSR